MARTWGILCHRSGPYVTGAGDPSEGSHQALARLPEYLAGRSELLGLCTELTISGACTASDCQPTIRYLENIAGTLNHRMRREQGEGACLHMNPPSERVCDVYTKRTRKTVDSA